MGLTVTVQFGLQIVFIVSFTSSNQVPYGLLFMCCLFGYTAKRSIAHEERMASPLCDSVRGPPVMSPSLQIKMARWPKAGKCIWANTAF